jgi:hypothetical protein
MMLHRFDVPRSELLHDIILPKSLRFFTPLEDRVHVRERQTANEYVPLIARAELGDRLHLSRNPGQTFGESHLAHRLVHLFDIIHEVHVIGSAQDDDALNIFNFVNYRNAYQEVMGNNLQGSNVG